MLTDYSIVIFDSQIEFEYYLTVLNMSGGSNMLMMHSPVCVEHNTSTCRLGIVGSYTDMTLFVLKQINIY